MRLKRSDCSGVGIRRRRAGRGFTYLDAEGDRVTDPQTIDRIKALAIPPAWIDVWICPTMNGHIQATGFDDAGRKQYLYHEHWSRTASSKKFNEMLEFSRKLPGLRKAVNADIDSVEATREAALACAYMMSTDSMYARSPRSCCDGGPALKTSWSTDRETRGSTSSRVKSTSTSRNTPTGVSRPRTSVPGTAPSSLRSSWAWPTCRTRSEVANGRSGRRSSESPSYSAIRLRTRIEKRVRDLIENK